MGRSYPRREILLSRKSPSGRLPAHGGAVRFNPLWLSVLLPACGLSEDNFLDKFANKSCDLYFDCEDELEYDLKWDDKGECVEFFEGITQEQGDEADCEYDEDAAHDCLAAIDDMECSDLDDGDSIPECEDVYTGDCSSG
jgi:hypothetical protein